MLMAVGSPEWVRHFRRVRPGNPHRRRWTLQRHKSGILNPLRRIPQGAPSGALAIYTVIDMPERKQKHEDPRALVVDITP